MMGITLRYPYEVRKQPGYFENIKDEECRKICSIWRTDEFGRKDRATRATGAASWNPSVTPEQMSSAAKIGRRSRPEQPHGTL